MMYGLLFSCVCTGNEKGVWNLSLYQEKNTSPTKSCDSIRWFPSSFEAAHLHTRQRTLVKANFFLCSYQWDRKFIQQSTVTLSHKLIVEIRLYLDFYSLDFVLWTFPVTFIHFWSLLILHLLSIHDVVHRHQRQLLLLLLFIERMRRGSDCCSEYIVSSLFLSPREYVGDHGNDHEEQSLCVFPGSWLTSVHTHYKSLSGQTLKDQSLFFPFILTLLSRRVYFRLDFDSIQVLVWNDCHEGVIFSCFTSILSLTQSVYTLYSFSIWDHESLPFSSTLEPPLQPPSLPLLSIPFQEEKWK